MAQVNISDASGKEPRKIGFLANQPKDSNYAEPTAFKLVIGKIPETTYFCQSVSLPGISISEVQQRTMFNPIILPGGDVVHEPLSAKFIVSEGLNNWIEIYKWIQSCSTYKDFDDVVSLQNSLVSDATLYILSSKNNLEVKATFSGVFPKSLSSVEFDYSDTELMTIIASVDFAFSHYEIEVS